MMTSMTSMTSMASIREMLPVPSGWPEPPEPAAYHGLAGEIVGAIAPHTEADPVTVLFQLLVACGALIGRGAWFEVERTRHYPAEFVVLVAESSRARRGSAYAHVERLLGEIDPGFSLRVENGLSSGEGLVWALRDPDGKDAGAPDPGAPDRRLLVTEPEFARVLSGRKLSSLSPVLREAWDGEDLETLTRNSPLRATEAHLALIAQITATELRHYSTTISTENGLLKRFLFVACRRTQLLPQGGEKNPLAQTGLKDRLAQALDHAGRAGRLRLHSSARGHWRDAYEEMSKRSMEGVTGALTARAEAHSMRLALIYALLDGASSIKVEHLQAALALWGYAARSAVWALGDATGDPLADLLHRTLQENPAGLTRTQLHDSLHRNRPAAQIKEALAALEKAGRAESRKKKNPAGGRPAELWTATTPQTASTPETATTPGRSDSPVLTRVA
jgi:hypothetical protein